MSRGGHGGGRGGFSGGRGGFSASNPLPMGLTYQDIQSMNRDEDALYPPLDPTPVLTEYSDIEKDICSLQNSFAERLRRSAYCIVEPVKSSDLEHYSDKHRPSIAARPAIKRNDLYEPFFPRDVLESYFQPKKKRNIARRASKKFSLDDLVDNADEPENSDAGGSEAGSHPEEEDYDVDEEYDNDYADNYFDNGEGDDMDDLGGGDDGGGDHD